MATPVPLDPLLTSRKTDIDALRVSVADILPTYWDDIWLLRYVLSFPDESERIQAVRTCVAWREKNASLLADVAAGRPAPHDAIVRPNTISDFHTSSIYGEPLYIVRAGLGNPKTMMATVPPEQLLEWFMYHKEDGMYSRVICCVTRFINYMFYITIFLLQRFGDAMLRPAPEEPS